MSETNPLSRRAFVGRMASSAFAFTIVPRHVLGGPGYVAPSDRTNLALIGAGGRGMDVAQEAVVGGQNLVAIADVDFGYVQSRLATRGRRGDGSANPEGLALQDAYSRAMRYNDFREMLEKERNNIDGVLIETPDHGHAVQAMAAMQLGKAVYVEKPIAWSVHEARTLLETARRTGVVTQMGNQGHSEDNGRRMVEWIRSGVLGPIREVHVWTNRPVWPQGIPRPSGSRLRTQTANPTVVQPANAGQGAQAQTGPQPAPPVSWEAPRNIQQPLSGSMAGSFSVPTALNWDLFIGPSRMVDYHPIYHPFNWRGWVDWGVGALGDMGAHLLDQPYWALDLGLPVGIEATSTPFGMDVGDTPATWPQGELVQYDFPARGALPPVRLTWYDGGLMPPRPALMPDHVVLERAGGVIYVGEKGILYHGQRGLEPHMFFPESLRAEADRVPQTLERVPAGHVVNFSNAIMEKAKPSSDFEYGARLTETMLLGLVALRTGQGRKILYDGAAGRITNIPEANQLLHREYRPGWSL